MLLLLGVVMLGFNVRVARGTQPVFINADGSIAPEGAPITTVNKITYTLTGDVSYPTYSGIVDLRNNTLINGNGHTIQGNVNATTYGTCGVNLTSTVNVMVRNVVVRNFYFGIYVGFSSYDRVVACNVTANYGDGIHVESNSNYNMISGNNATANTDFGIDLYGYCDFNTVSGNNVTGNSSNGIEIETSCNNNTVTSNNASGNGIDGVEIYRSYNNIISSNNATSNANSGIGLYSLCMGNNVSSNNASANVNYGVVVYSSSNNTVFSNTASANQVDGVLLFYSCFNNTISGNSAIGNNQYGLELNSLANSNNVTGNDAEGNLAGVYVTNSSGNTVSGNHVFYNDNGIVMYNASSSNTVFGNSVVSNTNVGIGAGYFSLSNVVAGNNLTSNGDGVILDETCGSNQIYHNNFWYNSVQGANSGSTSVWDNGYPSGGNYWSDYNGSDIHSGPLQNLPGSDGIGDTSYPVSTNCSDHYPLMNYWFIVQSVATVTCFPNLVVRSSLINCTVSVTGRNPTGTVTWSASSRTGGFGSYTGNLSSGICSTTFNDNFTGSIEIAAYYSGDSNNMASIGRTIVTIVSPGPVYYSKNYTSVQTAINAAPSGATIIISPGTYSESLVVNKSLTIIGDRDAPTFQGGGSGVCITLLSGASGSVVSGIIMSAFDQGVSIINASNCGIYANIFSFIGTTGIGIQGNSASSNHVYDNLFQETPTPIKLATSTAGNVFDDNVVSSQASVGLDVETSGNSVYDNEISGNQIALTVASSSNSIYHNNFMAVTQITVTSTVNNAWDAGYPAGGNYWNTYSGVDQMSGPNQNVPGPDGIGDTPYTVAVNCVDHYPLMKPYTSGSDHSVEAMSVITTKRTVGLGYSCTITVVVADDGQYAETFSTTCYANTTALGVQSTSNLQAACAYVLTFTWNTASFAYGNYTLSAYAWPVPGQTSVAKNDFIGGTVKVTIPGDVNGDGIVDIYDAIILAGSFNTNPTSSHWNPNADINNDNSIDIYDAIILAGHFSQHLG